MSGIEILPDGKVLYQGKPINKYYIEGLDLLEGKYNLANKNLQLSITYDLNAMYRINSSMGLSKYE
jgi:hypothetical protein